VNTRLVTASVYPSCYSINLLLRLGAFLLNAAVPAALLEYLLHGLVRELAGTGWSLIESEGSRAALPSSVVTRGTPHTPGVHAHVHYVLCPFLFLPKWADRSVERPKAAGQLLKDSSELQCELSLHWSILRNITDASGYLHCSERQWIQNSISCSCLIS